MLDLALASAGVRGGAAGRPHRAARRPGPARRGRVGCGVRRTQRRPRPCRPTPAPGSHLALRPVRSDPALIAAAAGTRAVSGLRDSGGLVPAATTASRPTRAIGRLARRRPGRRRGRRPRRSGRRHLPRRPAPTPALHWLRDASPAARRGHAGLAAGRSTVMPPYLGAVQAATPPDHGTSAAAFAGFRVPGSGACRAAVCAARRSTSGWSAMPASS